MTYHQRANDDTMLLVMNDRQMYQCLGVRVAVYALRLGINAVSRDLELIAPGFGDRGARG